MTPQILNKTDLVTIRCIVDTFAQDREDKINDSFREHLNLIDSKLELLYNLAPKGNKHGTDG